MAKIVVQNTEVSVLKIETEDYISLTDMAGGKEGDSRAADIHSGARGLPRVSRAKLVATAEILGRQGYLNKPLAEKVEGHDNLFAITIHTGDNPRVFYAYDAGTVIWLLSGYYKKAMKIPCREIAKAESIKRRLGL